MTSEERKNKFLQLIKQVNELKASMEELSLTLRENGQAIWHVAIQGGGRGVDDYKASIYLSADTEDYNKHDLMEFEDSVPLESINDVELFSIVDGVRVFTLGGKQ